jgi:hypothetical protein
MITSISVFKSTRRKAEEAAAGLLMIIIASFRLNHLEGQKRQIERLGGIGRK